MTIPVDEHDYCCMCDNPKDRHKEDDLCADIASYRKTVANLEARLEKLNALEAAGVDNWEGYDDALEMMK